MLSRSFTSLFLLLALNLVVCSSGGDSGGGDSPAPTYPYVYFVGNSVTYVNDIPGRLRRIMEANNAFPEGYSDIASTAYGGHRLSDYLGGYLENTDNVNADKDFISQILSFEKGPLYLVLQEQSCGPHLNRTSRILPQYKIIASALGAEIILYQTWHMDCQTNWGLYSTWAPLEYRNSPQLYKDLAEEFSLALAPIGEIWQALRAAEDDILLTPVTDPVHQNELGASVNAAAFFYTLNPDSEMIPGILAQTGLDISRPRDDAYNQIIYNRVRNHSNSALQGTAGDNNGPSLQNPSGLLDLGGNPIQMPPNSLRIFRLPPDFAGNSLAELRCSTSFFRGSCYYNYRFLSLDGNGRVSLLAHSSHLPRHLHSGLRAFSDVPSEANYMVLMSETGIPEHSSIAISKNRRLETDALVQDIRVSLNDDLSAAISWRNPDLPRDVAWFKIIALNEDSPGTGEKEAYRVAFSGEEQSLKLEKLKQDTNYLFRLYYTGLVGGTSPKVEHRARTPVDTIPAAELQNLSINSPYYNRLELSWDSPQENLTHIILSYREDGSTEEPASMTISTVRYNERRTSWRIENLQADTSYEITVKTVKDTGLESAGMSYSFRTREADHDGDGLIEIVDSRHLQALSYDLNGDGLTDAGITVPSGTQGPWGNSGCPAMGCKGYELQNDIDLEGVTWTSIGSCGTDNDCLATADNSPYTAIFEGNSHKLSNLNSTDSFFKALSGTAEVRNLGFIRFSFGANADIAAGLADYNAGNISNCFVEKRFALRGTGYVGGLVGVNAGTIRNSYSQMNHVYGGNVDAERTVGILVALNQSGAKIINSHSRGYSWHFTFFGGKSSITFGSLVGRNQGEIKNSYAVHPRNDDPVFFGEEYLASSIVGGLVGQNASTGTVRYSYALYKFNALTVGDGEETPKHGGLIGENLGTVEYSYWSTDYFARGIGSSGTGASQSNVSGYTNTQLQSPTGAGTVDGSLYWNWGAEDWDFGDGSAYPALKFDMDLDNNGVVSAIEDPASKDATLLCLGASNHQENNQNCPQVEEEE